MRNPGELFAEFVYDSEKLPQNIDKAVTDVVELLKLRGCTIATAESCTGGLLSALITSVPGASQVFEFGLCTYSDRCKQALLQVPAETLAVYGAVSREVADAMVSGLQRQSGADLCISVTGLAGPGGGTTDLPVGTVYAGFMFGSIKFTSRLHLWELEQIDRERIRQYTALCVFGIAAQLLSEDENQ